MALSPLDPSSYARQDLAAVKHLHLELDVDFDRKVLKGFVVLSVEKKVPDTNVILLDTRDLVIHRVVDHDLQQPLNYDLADPVKPFGSRLTITLPPAQSCRVAVHYETSPESTALQWLEPQQTATKTHPYMFSQCQAIHARSMLPCQDTPGVKTTYSAQITTSVGLVALMSAVKDEALPHPSSPERTVHTFKQTVPIPSYLIAIVVGALHSRRIGPRSHVWSEASMVDAAAHEFSETEEMLQIAERLMGPYVWGVYDLLVLPPSFPYGGMENPCLTFVTPTLLAGDRSLASVVAHEISHSWTGNLVTNSSPQHFWLNEGHTKFVERKIEGAMGGEEVRMFSVEDGWRSLKNQVEVVFGSSHPFTVLVPDLTGVDPDDAFSTVPYEKGHALLLYLEQLLGGPAVFDRFLPAYINHFKYRSITTNEWKNFLHEFFSDQTVVCVQRSVLDTVDWDTWLYAPGMPPVKPTFQSSLAASCLSLATRWSECSDLTQLDDLEPLPSSQLREVLGQLLVLPPLTSEKITKMDEVYKLSGIKNSEVKFSWLRLCLRAKQEHIIDSALQFVTEQGRLKFVRPIYRDLFTWSASRDRATKNYHRHCSCMHPLTASMVAKDMSATVTS